MSASPIIGIREQGALDLVRSLLRQGVVVRIKVSGDSMKPLLHGGETVEIAPLQAERPKVGDILFLRGRRNTPLVHRLLRCRYYDKMLHLQTKGDACSGFDGFVPADQVLGRVQRIIISREASCADGGSGGTTDLRTPVMRLKARMIVSRSLMHYYIRRIIAALLTRSTKYLAILSLPL